MSSIKSRYLQLLVLVCALFGARDLRAEEADELEETQTGPVTTYAGEVTAEPPFIPVMMTDVSGDVAGDTQAKLLEALSRALQKAALKSYAERVYGTGKEFAGREKTGGPLSMFGTIMGDFDTYLETEISDVARTAPRGSFSVSVEALLAKPSAQLPAAIDVASGHPLRMLWQVGRVAASDSLTASQVNLLDNIAGLAIVSKRDLPDAGQSLYDQGAEVYEWMATDTQKKFLPLYERLTLSIDNGAVSLGFDVYVKPGSIYKDGFDNNGKLFATRDLTYNPPFFSSRPPVMRLRFTRTYGGANNARPLLALDFGRMYSSDIREMNNCVNNCRDEIGKVPTVAIDLQLANIKALGQRSGADGLFANINQTAANFARARVVDFLSWTQNDVQSHTRFFILLNSLVIDLKDPAGPSIRPDRSQTPVVLRAISPWNGNRSYVTFNKYNTTVTAETDLSYLHLGAGKIGGSINLFEKYLGPPVAGGLTDSLRENLRKMDRASDAYVTKVLAPVTDLVNF